MRSGIVHPYPRTAGKATEYGMDNYINPTLLLGIIGGIVLFTATTVINGTIWATSIEVTAHVRDADSAAKPITPAGDDGKPGEQDALFQSGDTALRAMNRRSNRARNVPVDCVPPVTSPHDEMLDIVCELDL